MPGVTYATLAFQDATLDISGQFRGVWNRGPDKGFSPGLFPQYTYITLIYVLKQSRILLLNATNLKQCLVLFSTY
jgi:hypothetical protein